ncbi:MAG: Xaa-Pro peptidase family protein [Actinobacteria bacterium]|nr:Xaa-Pro peptidase family protein [Actinomycetota bacterium]
MSESKIDLPNIPNEEFILRMNRLKEKMKAKRIDLIVVYSNLLDPSSVRYLSDVSPINESAAVIVPLEGDPILCSGQACHEWSKYKSKIKDVRIMPEVGEVSGVEYDIEGQLDFKDLFKELKGKYDIKRTGIIGDLIFPYEIYKKLESVFPEAEKISADNLIYELRKQKSENEIACMKKAGEIITKAFEYAASRIKPGATELDIQADIESQMLRLGAEDHCLSFSPMIPSGQENSNLCMNRNTLRKVKENEIIDLQAGALYEGYNAALCTPFVLGEIPNEIKKAINVAYEALNTVVDAMKPGVSSKKLYDIYNGFLRRKGYREYSPYGSVHSIGMLECESPFFSANKDVFMVENMTVAIDAYFKGLPWGSFRVEDTFAIRNDGAEPITDYNKKHLLKLFK